MNKVTIFSGPQHSGKTTQARELTKQKNAVWLFKDCPESHHHKHITQDTDIVVFDEIRPFDIAYIAEFAAKEFISFRPNKAAATITMERPEILICTNLDATKIVELIDKKVEVHVINFQP